MIVAILTLTITTILALKAVDFEMCSKRSNSTKAWMSDTLEEEIINQRLFICRYDVNISAHIHERVVSKSLGATYVMIQIAAYIIHCHFE